MVASHNGNSFNGYNNGYAFQGFNMLNVMIFRNQLFKYSEPFISDQAEATGCNVSYGGRRILQFFGLKKNVFSLNDCSYLDNILYVIFRRTTPLYKLTAALPLNIIHAHFCIDAIYAVNLSKKMRVPLIVTCHGFDVTTSNKALLLSLKPAWINYLFFKRQLLENCDLFICVSDYIREKAIEKGFPPEKLITHYIGIEIPDAPNNKKYLNENIKILHVARLTEKKGTKYLLKALSKLKNPNVTLDIIGDGPLRDNLISYAKRLGIRHRVYFRGAAPHSEVLCAIEDCDIFCVPSVTAQSGDSEGLGMVFLEAAIKYTPVVATLHGGIPEAVVDGRTGFLVPEKNAEMLAAKLELLINSPRLRKQMGEAARKMVEDKFDIKKQSKKLEKIYAEVVHGMSANCKSII